jgi:hypothetical protein
LSHRDLYVVVGSVKWLCSLPRGRVTPPERVPVNLCSRDVVPRGRLMARLTSAVSSTMSAMSRKADWTGLGRAVRERREALRISQGAAGISVSTWHKVEHAIDPPYRRATLLGIAEALRVDARLHRPRARWRRAGAHRPGRLRQRRERPARRHPGRARPWSAACAGGGANGHDSALEHATGRSPQGSPHRPLSRRQMQRHSHDCSRARLPTARTAVTRSSGDSCRRPPGAA